MVISSHSPAPGEEFDYQAASRKAGAGVLGGIDIPDPACDARAGRGVEPAAARFLAAIEPTRQALRFVGRRGSPA